VITSVDFHPSAGPIPRHVGIIPDGGRRWAKAHSCELRDAYLFTRSSLRILVGLLIAKGVEEISIYLSSIQNFRRDQQEIGVNLEMVQLSLAEEIYEMAGEMNIRVVVAGNREILSASLTEKITAIEHLTEQHRAGRLNLLVAYDPIEEVLQAINSSVSPPDFIRHLWVTTPVDIVIRTGGVQLLSDFLPLQSAYARLYFENKLFNDLIPEDVIAILGHFAQLERKFGT